MLSYKLPVCYLRRPPRATWIYSVTQQLMAICLRLSNVQSHDVGLISTAGAQTRTGKDQVIKRCAVPRVNVLALAFLFSFWDLNDSFRAPKRWRLGRRLHQYKFEQDLGITTDHTHTHLGWLYFMTSETPFPGPTSFPYPPPKKPMGPSLGVQPWQGFPQSSPTSLGSRSKFPPNALGNLAVTK